MWQTLPFLMLFLNDVDKYVLEESYIFSLILTILQSSNFHGFSDFSESGGFDGFGKPLSSIVSILHPSDRPRLLQPSENLPFEPDCRQSVANKSLSAIQ